MIRLNFLRYSLGNDMAARHLALRSGMSAKSYTSFLFFKFISNINTLK